MSQIEPRRTPLAVKRIGEGVPVLFVHGWQIDGAVEAADFEPIFSQTNGYQRIYVDLPGMGATPANSIRDLDDIYCSVSHFIKQHISPAKFLLVGTSCGAYIARALATQYSSQVLGLLLRVPLIDPAHRDIDAFKPVIRNDAVMASMSPGLRRSLGNIPVQTQEYVGKFAAKMADLIIPAFAAAQNDVLESIRNDPMRYRLDLIDSGNERIFDKPSLIITGRQDEAVGYKDSLRLLQLYPRATYVLLDRGVHALPIDEDEMFKASILDWLRRVEESVKHDSKL